MRELLRTVVTGKPIIALLEPESSHGGLTREQVREQLDIVIASLSASWGLDEKVESWGYEMPSAIQLYDALFARDPIEWNRIGRFQDITMRLIAERLLPSEHPPTRMPSEFSNQRRVLVDLREGCRFHAYCSPNNPGAKEMLLEAAETLRLRILVSEHLVELSSCEGMLVYLTSLTWADDELGDAFTEEVSRAMAQGVPLLLAHEVPGLGGQETRHGEALTSNLVVAQPA